MILPTVENTAELIAAIGAGCNPDFLFFFGHHQALRGVIDDSCLSQWYPAPFTIDGITYSTAEHWMMAEKARHFNDPETLAKILQAGSPYDAKKLGREVRNFDSTWDKQASIPAVTAGNIAKFGQNPKLGDFLRATGDKVLVEASPYDHLWGIKLGKTAPGIRDPRNWRGKNKLGFSLMAARTSLG